MEIVLASHNKKKIKELKDLLCGSGLGDLTVLSLTDVGFFDEIEENGNSFAENAMIKASAVRRDGAIIVSDDSGLCVDALGGAPGIYSARFAGPDADDAKNNALLLKKLENAPDRSAAFVSVIACILPDGRRFTVRGECRGVIIPEPRGENGFGYDPLFFLPDRGVTFAELSADEKNAISHRGKAMRTFIAELKKHLFETER